MHGSLQTPATSSGSSSQSQIPWAMTAADPYPCNSLSSFSSSASLPPYEQGGSSEEEEGGYDGLIDMAGHDEEQDKGYNRERMGSQSSSTDQKDGVQKRKPRITLARGGACVVCRNRKLKCTGERPCASCVKAGTECVYEVLQRRKPKAVLMEERMATLESMLGLAPGEPTQNAVGRLVPAAGPSTNMRPERLAFEPLTDRRMTSPPARSGSSNSMTGNPAAELHQHLNLAAQPPSVNASMMDIAPNSPLETALINIVLPHTPYLLMPIHPERFLALLTLPAHDLRRPHPALLYILFAEAVTILERNTPPPIAVRPPITLFAETARPLMPPPMMNHEHLGHLRGMSGSLLDRAQAELQTGIRNVDRPFDLARAAIGIARLLYSHGRFIEGWNVPVSRLVISCGLHRLTGNYTPPNGPHNRNFATGQPMPLPYAPAHHYPLTGHSYASPDGTSMPVLRMRPVIIPPPRDEIDVAERTATFWAAKMQDWEAGCGWGWTTALADDECTTQWPWGWGVPEPKFALGLPDEQYSLRHLHDPSSLDHNPLFPDTTYTLALKSLALLHRASHLFDLPESSLPTLRPDGRFLPTHVPSLVSVKAVEVSLGMFRDSIPAIFAFDAVRAASSMGMEGQGMEVYDGFNDPWWIMLHANLCTAGVMMWKEKAHYDVNAYGAAVGCARAMVGVVRQIRPDQWPHVDMIVALDISLCSRFLYKESDRLQQLGDYQSSAMAKTEAEILLDALNGEYSKWLPMARLHGLIVKRVREGWSEKEGEYERI